MPVRAPRACPHPGCPRREGTCPDHDQAGPPRITLICGPPCAGKTTLARVVAAPSDVVLDFDTIAVRLGSPHRWRHPPGIVTEAEDVMRAHMRALRDSDRRGWVIRCLPHPARRTRLARALGARVWLLDPGQVVCRARAQRDGRPAGTLTAIRDWYRTYRPCEVDQCPPEHPAPALTLGAGVSRAGAPSTTG